MCSSPGLRKEHLAPPMMQISWAEPFRAFKALLPELRSSLPAAQLLFPTIEQSELLLVACWGRIGIIFAILLIDHGGKLGFFVVFFFCLVQTVGSRGSS